MTIIEGNHELPLDDGGMGDATNGGVVLLDSIALIAGNREAPDRDGPLRERVHLSVHAEQGRCEQRSPLQIRRVPNRRHGHVHGLPDTRKRREIRGHHDRGHVRDADLVGIDDDAELCQEAGEGLVREQAGAAVAGSLQPDDEPVSDQRVRADSLHLGQVLDLDGVCTPAEAESQEKRQGGQREAHQNGRIAWKKRISQGTRWCSLTTPSPP